MKHTKMLKQSLKWGLVLLIAYVFTIYILEFIFGPRLGHNGITSMKNSHVPSTEFILRHHGYPLEIHEVTTDSGYIITIHRIPNGKKGKANSFTKPIVMFQHGLLAASDTWLIGGPNKDLPYILADDGYDVWMINMRGNIYSRKHVELDSDKDAKYWEFGLHEIGYQDLAVSIDYALKEAKQESIIFMGHSIGSSALFILCSLKPEYNAKIRFHVALAPVANIKHELTVFHKTFLAVTPSIFQTLVQQNIHELLPRRSQQSTLLHILCQDGMPTQQLCVNFLFAVAGTSHEELNTTSLPKAFAYYPAGSSLHVFNSVCQIYSTRNFTTYDFGDEKINMEHYNSSQPISYDLTKVTHPVSLHYSKNDLLVTEEDIDFLEEMLPNVIGKFLVPSKQFNHIDFMWGKNAKDAIYDKILVLLNKYR